LEDSVPVLRLLDVAEAWLVRAIRIALILATLILVVVVSYQVISRVSELLPQWRATEELARGMFVWLVALGASLGVRNGSHFNLDLFAHKDAAFKQRLAYLRVVVVGAIAAIFVFHGWEFLNSGFRRRSLITGLSSAWWYSSFFVAGCLMTLFTVREAAGMLLGRPRAGAETSPGAI
jgi:TRAP-type transport system small permease protein